MTPTTLFVPGSMMETSSPALLVWMMRTGLAARGTAMISGSAIRSRVRILCIVEKALLERQAQFTCNTRGSQAVWRPLFSPVKLADRRFLQNEPNIRFRKTAVDAASGTWPVLQNKANLRKWWLHSYGVYLAGWESDV